MALGLFVLRVIIGALFVGHGAQKLGGKFGGHGLDGTSRMFESLGLRPGRTQAIAAGIAEVAGGALLMLGLVVPLAACLLSGVMLMAIWKVHAAKGPWVTDGGFEYNLVLLAAVFALAAVGAGTWSLDHAANLSDANAGWAIGQLIVAAIGVAVLDSQGERRPASTGGSYRTPRSNP
jgi:putative oxidoreductase